MLPIPEIIPWVGPVDKAGLAEAISTLKAVRPRFESVGYRFICLEVEGKPQGKALRIWIHWQLGTAESLGEWLEDLGLSFGSDCKVRNQLRLRWIDAMTQHLEKLHEAAIS